MTVSELTKVVIDRFFNIRTGSDANTTIRDIQSNISIKGYNVWILICSSLLASIGLDESSPAVIIGAMLISPLMSPILGIGLSLGIQDKDILMRSLKNLGLATFVSLAASFLYFSLTPLGQITTEILSRTKPTLLDIGVAFFGGIAGIVSGSRTEKTNAIPGVAIATALMPPICSAGFGLAKGDWAVFGGAFYLFFLNAVFISISTFMIVKYLKFPVKQYLNDATRKKVTMWVSVGLFVIVLPSGYFLWDEYQKVSLNNEVGEIIVADLEARDFTVEMGDIVDKDSFDLIKFMVSPNSNNPSDFSPTKEEERFNARLRKEGFKKHRVHINYLSYEDRKEQEELLTNNSLRIEDVSKNVEGVANKLEHNIAKIDSLKEVIDKKVPLSFDEKTVERKLEIFCGDAIKKCTYGSMNVPSKGNQKPIPALWIEWKKNVSSKRKKEVKKKCEDFLMLELGVKEVKISE